MQKGEDHMPLIMPIKDLRNTSEISEIAHKEREPIFITKNGKTIAKVSNPNVSAVDAISGLLAGKLPADYDAKSLREERLRNYAPDA